jgi:hypothetical protein
MLRPRLVKRRNRFGLIQNGDEIHEAPKEGAYSLLKELGFPQLPVGMLFDRAVSFHCSLDAACNMEDGRHGRSGWLLGKGVKLKLR